MAIFKKEYIQKHPVDNQIQIQVPAVVSAEVKKIYKDYYKVTCDKPVTKNGSNSFNITEETKQEYLSD